MLVYFVVFILAIIFYKLGIYNKKKTNFVFICISIFIPSFLAACRTPDIGRDIQLYVLPIWNNAVWSNDFASFQSANSNNEILYICLNYVISRLTNEFGVYLFIHQAIICSLVTIVALRVKDKFDSSFVVCFYYLFFYNATYSLMRQSIAIFIILYVSLYVFTKEYKKYYMGNIVAILSHSSAVFALLLYPFKLIVDYFKNSKLKLFILITSLVSIVYFTYYLLLSKFIAWGILSLKYENYLEQSGFKSHKIDLVFYLSIILIIYFFTKKKNRNVDYCNYCIFILLLCFYLTLVGDVVEVANRVAYYFAVPLFYLLPMSTRNHMESLKVRWAVIALLLVRYLYLGLSTGIADTIPYHSDILGL